jgi:hypothetical protein
MQTFDHRRNFAVDWQLAIIRNRDQLKAIVLTLFALAGMRVGGSLLTLRRAVVSAIMLVLRPAESCVRRLIVIAAQGLKFQSRPLAGEAPGCAGRQGDLPPTRAFKLFDPLKSFDPEDFWDEAQSMHEQALRSLDPASGFHIIDETLLNATHLGHRLNAILRALNDLPRQARRLKRWELKRNQRLAAMTPTRFSSMRPGLPPGWRERKVHEIDDVLRECHGLANERLNSG